MVNINKLKGKIVEENLSTDELSKMLNIDRSTFYRKLQSNGDTFTVKEASMITDILKLTREEAVAIFFSQYVA